MKIAIILLLPALPCALPALVLALKSRQLCRLGEYTRAWQYSHRAFFCCFTGLITLALVLLVFMVLMYTRSCNCLALPTPSPHIASILPPDPSKKVISRIDASNNMMKLASQHVQLDPRNSFTTTLSPANEFPHTHPPPNSGHYPVNQNDLH